MKKIFLFVLCLGLISLMMAKTATAATEQAKQLAIDNGLAWLASTQQTDGRWLYTSWDGDLAATGSAALAFIEEGYLPGSDVVINSVNYGDVVGKACDYIFNRATSQAIGTQTMGHPEDYDNNGSGDGNSLGIYFNPGSSNRNVYTTGIITPVVYALGQALGENTAVGRGTVSTMTYKQVLRDVIDWYSWGQVDPAYGNHRGGWRYNANYTTSDNSTAQWGSLPILYGNTWGLATPQCVKDELELYVNYIQHSQDSTWRAGGSGYDTPDTYVNMAKTGGLMLELAAIGEPVSDTRVQNALGFMESTISFDHWNQGYFYSSTEWYSGHLNNPYAMWAVYKALEVYGIDTISTAPGGFTVGQNWDPQTSAAGDWYAHYCDYIAGIQNTNGSWNGAGPWTGALATGWYINILNAAGAPEPVDPVPEPSTMILMAFGLFGMGMISRRKRAK